MAATTSDPIQQRVQAVLPDYKVLTELGRGAMGVVYLGQHRVLGRKVAIKLLPSQLASDEDVRSRFRSEAQTCAKFDHPHIVRVNDFKESDGMLLLIMEELPGGTVWERFTESGFTPPQAVAVVMATCSGLHHAHERQVLHRDIKPENVMFAEDGTLKVTDFGIAKVLAGAGTLATVDGGVLGTPAYMAPEQAMAIDVGPQADVYATGTMLYELMTGRLPFREVENPMAMLFQRVNEDPEPIWNIADHVPPAVGEVTMRAIARDPADRWATPEEFGVAIGEAAALSWGPEWLRSSGLVVRGSDALVEAARTTRTAPVPDSAHDDTVAASRGNATIVDGASVDVAPASAPSPDTSSPDTPPTAAPPAAAPPTAAPPTVAPAAGEVHNPTAMAAAPVAAAAAMPMPTAAITPQVRNHVAGGIDLENFSAEDLVDIDDVITPPPFPFIHLLAGLAALALMVGLAFTGLADPTRDEDLQVASVVALNGESVVVDGEIDLDLAEPIVITVANPAAAEASLGFSIVGVPLGSLTGDVVGGQATIDPGPYQYIPAGGVTGTVTLLDAAGDELGSTDTGLKIRDGWLTAVTLVGVLLALGFLAYFESNARPLRKGRRRISRLIGMGLTGAVAGLTSVIAASIVSVIEPTIPAFAIAAVLGFVGCVLLGLAFVAMARRRRLKA